tara:strand:- start:1474 stop:2964 length:1491 start_codon:yes stop_codon:yes gene_type:complete
MKQTVPPKYMARWSFFGKSDEKEENPDEKLQIITSAEVRTSVPHRHPFTMMAGVQDIIKQSESLRKDTNYDNDFYLFDDMLKLDPELNGAVRAVSLTANNYRLDYSRGKNSRIRDAIKLLTETTIDFDDFLINALRNLMVYGNDVNKLVGRTGVGIEDIQSLPIAQVIINDDRAGTTTPGRDNPIMTADKYYLRKGEQSEVLISSEEVLHIRMDYRSNWYQDYKNQWTYGVWGASRFTSLKQAIRAKYNTINNRISLEDSMTKQFITIGKEAIEHIQDPDEQRERLKYIMDTVVATLEGLRGDQVPIFPDYVKMQFADTRNSLPDNSSFLDTVNADIAAVLQVPRVAAGQERGSTFAATFNANMWATQAITRMQAIIQQACQRLFSKHLELLGIDHTLDQLPTIDFEPVAEESRMDSMRRASLGWTNGLLTLNQCLEILGQPQIGEEGDIRNTDISSQPLGELPRENEQDSDKPTDEEDDSVIQKEEEVEDGESEA